MIVDVMAYRNVPRGIAHHLAILDHIAAGLDVNKGQLVRKRNGIKSGHHQAIAEIDLFAGIHILEPTVMILDNVFFM